MGISLLDCCHIMNFMFFSVAIYHPGIRRKSHPLCDNKRRFCKDLVLSMSSWPMCNACKVTVTDRLLGPDFGEFLDNVKASLEAIHQVANCNCQRDTRHEGYFQPCE